MHKKTKIFISLLFIFISSLFFQISFAKYVIEDIHLAAKLDIDRCKPNIELLDITSTNVSYPTYANKTHIITVHIKLTEKNIVRNNLSSDNIKVMVANQVITPEVKNFSLISENATEKIYEFSFTNTTGDGNLLLTIPGGIIEDKSGLLNEQKYFFTNLHIDNTPPVGTFTESSTSDGKSKAIINSNEIIQPINGWTLSNNSLALSREFTNYISYALPIMDKAQNSSEVLINIQKATNILLEYGSRDDYSKMTLVSGGSISAPQTISTNSICKSEAIFVKISGNVEPNFLQGKVYVYTHWGENARGICRYSEIYYYHGYNPTSSTEWFNINSDNLVRYYKMFFTQLGGVGLNITNANASNIKNPIPSNIAKQYLYGISGIQFRLNNNTNYSIIYQAYVKDIRLVKSFL